MTDEPKPRTEAKRIADLEAVIGELKDKIGELTDSVVELGDEVDELRTDLRQLEADNEDRTAIQLGAYRAILTDLDCLFGFKHLPFALQASLTAFGELL